MTCGVEPEAPIPIGAGAHTESCSVIFDDVDTFEFVPANDGRLARVMVSSLGAHIDPHLVIRDPLDQVIFDDWCDGGSAATPLPRCAVAWEAVPTIAGTYTAEVSDFGEEEADFYVLQFEMLPGDADDLITLDSWVEFETLGERTDMDHYEVLLVPDDFLTIELESCDDFLDPHIQIWGPDDSLIAEDWCTTPTGIPPPTGGPTDCSNEVPGSTTLCTAKAEVEITELGIYSFTISDYGSDESGRYQYTLPEPGGLGLAAGMALLSVLSRRRLSANRRRLRGARGPSGARG